MHGLSGRDTIRETVPLNRSINISKHSVDFANNLDCDCTFNRHAEAHRRKGGEGERSRGKVSFSRNSRIFAVFQHSLEKNRRGRGRGVLQIYRLDTQALCNCLAKM